MKKITLPHGNSWIIIIPKIDSRIEMSEEEYQELWSMRPQKRAHGKIFGKEIDFPRWHATFGQTYKFKGMEEDAIEITHPYLKKIMKWVRGHSEILYGERQNYRQLLVNWYGNGDDYIGAHTDAEPMLKENSAIYSFSFGQERDFVIKSKDKTYRKVIKMLHNSVIIMGGEMQKYYKHSVPKRTTKTCNKSRINMTMRLFK